MYCAIVQRMCYIVNSLEAVVVDLYIILLLSMVQILKKHLNPIIDSECLSVLTSDSMAEGNTIFLSFDISLEPRFSVCFTYIKKI